MLLLSSRDLRLRPSCPSKAGRNPEPGANIPLWNLEQTFHCVPSSLYFRSCGAGTQQCFALFEASNRLLSNSSPRIFCISLPSFSQMS